MIAKITSKGQVTIPKRVREILGTDFIEFQIDKEQVWIRPVVSAKGSLASYADKQKREQEAGAGRAPLQKAGRAVTVVDANVVLRYPFDDVPDQSEKATELIERSRVFIPHEVLAEVVRAVSGVYSVERSEIGRSLRNLLAQSTVRVTKREVASTAVDLCGSSGLDFVACLLVGCRRTGSKVATFDQKLLRELGKCRDVAAPSSSATTSSNPCPLEIDCRFRANAQMVTTRSPGRNRVASLPTSSIFPGSLRIV